MLLSFNELLLLKDTAKIVIIHLGQKLRKVPPTKLEGTWDAKNQWNPWYQVHKYNLGFPFVGNSVL